MKAESVSTARPMRTLERITIGVSIGEVVAQDEGTHLGCHPANIHLPHAGC